MADNNLTTKEEFLLNPVEEHNITDAAVASFETNLKHPLKVTVPITPQQDLHGIPNPYPAGASVNLIPDGTDTSNGYVSGYRLNADGTTAVDTNCYISEYITLVSETTYTWSDRVNTNVAPSICFYDENKEFISGIAINNQYSYTFTPPEGAVYCRSSQTTYAYQEANSSNGAFQLEVGSTATAYRRYSNVCPINGFNKTNVSNGKKNLLSLAHQYTSNGVYNMPDGFQMKLTERSAPFLFDNGDGSFTFNNMGTWTSAALKIPVVKGKHYYFRYQPVEDKSESHLRCGVYFCDKDNRLVKRLGISSAVGDAWYNGTCDDDGQYILIGFERRSASSDPFPFNTYLLTLSVDNYLHTPMPSANYLPITFTDPSTGDPMTIYGGSLTLNEDGSADLIATHVCYTITGGFTSTASTSGTYEDENLWQTWNYLGNGPFKGWGYPNTKSVSQGWPNVIMSNFPRANVPGIGRIIFTRDANPYARIYLKESLLTDVSTASAALASINEWCANNPIQVCYDLLNPQTYHFPNVGQLKAFLGENNVWSDIGNVDVKYLTQHSETGLEYRGDRALELRRRAMMADAPKIHTTVGSEETGGLASFRSYVKAPVKKIEIPFSPKQDLHGYDNPWPGGGGKNLLNTDGTDTDNGYVESYYLQSNGNTHSGYDGFITEYIPLQAETQYVLSSASGNSPSICYYDSSKQYITGTAYGKSSGTINLAITTPTNTAYCRVSVPNSYKNAMMLESGSTATAYAPYENICPIEGHDGCHICHEENNKYVPRFINWQQKLNDALSAWSRSTYVGLRNEDGYTVVSTSTSSQRSYYITQSVNIIAEHVYIFFITITNLVSNTAYSLAGNGNMNFAKDQETTMKICRKYTTDYDVLTLHKYSFAASKGDIFKYKNAMLLDLTEILGEEMAEYVYELEQNETGAGVNWFESVFPKEYYAYTPEVEEQVTVSSVNEDQCSIIPLMFNQAGNYELSPIQNGTGTPSPENVRLINPRMTFTRDDDSVLSVYGGTLTVNMDGTGSLVSELGIFTSNDSTGWTVFGSGGFFYKDALNTDVLTGTYEAPFRCNKYILATAIPNSSYVESRNDNTYFTQTNYPKRLWIKDTSLDATLESLNASLAATPLQVSYPLAEPVTYTLSVTETNRALEALGLSQHIGPLYGGTITINPDGSADVLNEYLYQVFTGTESWAVGGTQEGRYFYRKQIAAAGVIDVQEPMYCSHLPYSNITATNTIIGIRVSGSSAYGGDQLFVRPYWIAGSSDGERITQFQTWLADQYANGTPVVIAQKLTNADRTHHFSNLEQLKVWLGENNFWCDISDDITVKYWNRG